MNPAAEKSPSRHYICQVCAQGFTVPKPQQWPHVCPTCSPEGNAPCVVMPAVESVPAWAFHPTSMPVRDQVCLPELLSLIARITAFQTKTFPARTLQGMLTHLVKEAREVADCAGTDPHEWADVLNLLIGAALLKGWTVSDLVRFGHEKITICESRQWPTEPGPDGCYHHVKHASENSEAAWQPVAIDLQNDRGVCGPDSAWVKLRDGRAIEIGDEGLNVFRSLSDFESGFEPEHSISFSFNSNPQIPDYEI